MKGLGYREMLGQVEMSARRLRRQRDEAVGLLVDVEKYNHEFISPGWMARRNAFLASLETET